MAEDTQVVKSTGLQTFSNVEEARKMADDLVNQAIVSLKKPVTIPKTKGVDLSIAEDSTDRASVTRDETNATIDFASKSLEAASRRQQEAIIGEGKASADKIMADQAQAQEIANTQRYYAELFGISMNPDADVAVVAQRMRALQPGAEAKLKRIQEMQKVGLLDNPLEWFTNQIQLPAAIGDYNGEANLINSLQAEIDNSIKTGQDAANFAQRGIPTITTAQAKAEAKKAEQIAIKNAAVAEENFLKNNVTYAVQKLANDLNIANADRTMSGLELQNEQTKYQSLINEINLADKHSERMLKAAALLEKLEGTKGLDVLLEQYDRTMGHPKGTTNRYVFEKFGEAQRQNMVAIGAGSIGADPFEGMINWFKSRPGPGASRETQTFFNYLRDKAEIIAQGYDVQKLDEKQKSAGISKRLKDQIGKDVADASKAGSIFYEMPPSAMIGSGSIPADSPVAKMLEPYTKQSGPVSTDIVLEAFNKEFKNPSEAGAAIADYYSRNMQLRNSVMNTSLAGISLPKDYKIRRSMSDTEAAFSGTFRADFDLTKPEQATKFILLKRAAEMAAAMPEKPANDDTTTGFQMPRKAQLYKNGAPDRTMPFKQRNKYPPERQGEE